MRYLICDDVNRVDFWKLERLKERISYFKVTCFVMGKDAGDYLLKNWIEVGVHGWTHDYPPECERENQEEYIIKGIQSLRLYLPKYYGFRAPGFQLLARSYPIIRKLGFYYIAHQSRIQVFNGSFVQGELINTHIYDDSLDRVKDGEFNFLSEGIS